MQPWQNPALEETRTRFREFARDIDGSSQIQASYLRELKFRNDAGHLEQRHTPSVTLRDHAHRF